MKTRGERPAAAATGSSWLPVLLAAVLGLAGCYPPSALELDYGNSVRNNLAQQVVNPRAGLEPTPAVGLPPKAAQNELERYDKSFKGEEKKPFEMKLISPF